MIHDESSRTLKARALARLSFQRRMELGIGASIAGGVGGAVLSLDVASRSHAPWLLGIPVLLGLALATFFYLRWWAPPESAIDRFARDIRTKRKAGLSPAAPSRTFIVIVSIAACAFAIAVVRTI